MFWMIGDGLNGDSYDEEDDRQSDPWGSSRNFRYDPLYYHNRIYVEIVHETELAMLLEDSKGKFWVPKKLLRVFDDEIWVYNKFNIRYLEEE